MVAESVKSQALPYRKQTLRPLHSLAFILPMLIAFQVGEAHFGTSLLAHHDLHKLLGLFGGTETYLPALLVVVVLVAMNLLQKNPPSSWKIDPKVMAGMFGESILWTVPLIGLSQLTGRLVQQQATQTVQVNPAEWGPAVEKILQAFGAGIFEEFLFRLMLIGLVLLITVQVFGLKKAPSAILAIALGAMMFSLYHFSMDQIRDIANFPWMQFLFFAASGVYLGGLMVLRGFGICVAAHGLYNLYVLATQQSVY